MRTHRAHVDAVLDCLQKEMRLLSDYEKMEASERPSKRDVVEYLRGVKDALEVRNELAIQMEDIARDLERQLDLM